ncbi:MAG: hypothetical protein FD130_1633 [Halothiobacillaceae bacterium]|nr:MAG: hypothetical protein FD130_1633 [Halothiobacillaceae bacterium]
MAEALDMGKYGVYVWGSFGVTALALVVELVWVRQQQRTILQRIGRMVRMAARQKNEE